MSSDKPVIKYDVFSKLKEEKFFSEFVSEQFEYTVGRVKLHPYISPSRMKDAFQSWHRDIERMPADSMPGEWVSQIILRVVVFCHIGCVGFRQHLTSLT